MEEPVVKRKGGSRRGAPMLSVAASLRSRSSRASAKLAKSGGDGDGDRSSSQTRSTRKTTGSGGGFFGDEELRVDEEEQELEDGRRSMSSFATTDDRTSVSTGRDGRYNDQDAWGSVTSSEARAERRRQDRQSRRRVNFHDDDDRFSFTSAPSAASELRWASSKRAAERREQRRAAAMKAAAGGGGGRSVVSSSVVSGEGREGVVKESPRAAGAREHQQHPTLTRLEHQQQHPRQPKLVANVRDDVGLSGRWWNEVEEGGKSPGEPQPLVGKMSNKWYNADGQDAQAQQAQAQARGLSPRMHANQTQQPKRGVLKKEGTYTNFNFNAATADGFVDRTSDPSTSNAASSGGGGGGGGGVGGGGRLPLRDVLEELYEEDNDDAFLYDDYDDNYDDAFRRSGGSGGGRYAFDAGLEYGGNRPAGVFSHKEKAELASRKKSAAAGGDDDVHSPHTTVN